MSYSTKATDADFGTAWQCATNSDCWLDLAFNGPKAVDKVVIAEYGERITGYKLQRWDGSRFQDHYLGYAVVTKYIGKIRYLDIPQTTTSGLRLYITSSTHTPIVYEFQAYDAT